MRLAASLLLFALPAQASDSERLLLWLTVGSALPLLAVCATAFAKAAVLLGILRGGLAAPGALPATVLTGLAALLALLVMAPIGRQMHAAVGDLPADDAASWATAAERAWPPLEGFLVAHTDPVQAEMVREVSVSLDPTAAAAPISPVDRILAFVVSELRVAFELGVLLLLPFLIVDLLVANTLISVGFALLPPAAIALPLKLLLFVTADGWGLFVRGFAGTYG